MLSALNKLCTHVHRDFIATSVTRSLSVHQNTAYKITVEKKIITFYVFMNAGVGIIIFHRIISSPETGSLRRVQASLAGLLWRDSHSRPSAQPPL